MNRIRTVIERLQAIKDQMTFIKNSCDLFDRGCNIEAIRIVNALNILLNPNDGLLDRISFQGLIFSTIPHISKFH